MRHRTLSVFILLLVCLMLPSRAPGADLRLTVEALTVNPDRSAGSLSARENADYLADQLRRVTSQPVLRQAFLLTLPVVESCSATDRTAGSGGAAIALAPLLPCGGQAAALPSGAGEQSAADLLYVGNGTLAELRGKDLAHRLVAMNAGSGPLAWQTAASLGARAIVFLADDRTRAPDLLDKATSLPLGIPRFYCDDPAAVGRIKSGEVRTLAIDVRIRWQEKQLENLFCFLPGDLNAKQYIILQARYDASSQVMGQAPGASQAIAPAELLNLAEKIAAAPHHVAVLFLLTAGDEWNFRGTRAALDLLHPELADAASALADLRRQVADAGERLDTATRVSAGIDRIAAGDFSALETPQVQTAEEDQLLRASAGIESLLQHTRFAHPDDSAVLASLEAQKQDLLSATAALAPDFARSEAQSVRLKSIAHDLLGRWQSQVARVGGERDALRAWIPIRTALADRSPMLLFSLAITSGSPRFGFFARSSYSPSLNFTSKVFAQSLRRYAPPSASFPPAGFVPGSLEKRFTLESFFPLPMGFSSDAALARGLPAGALATTQDPGDFLDTPNDTRDRINYPNLRLQEQGLMALLLGTAGAPSGNRQSAIGNRQSDDLEGLLTDPALYIRNDLNNQTADQDVTLFESSSTGESLPHLTAANCLIGGESEAFARPVGPPLVGTRRFDWYLTDAAGTITFTSAPRFAVTRLQAFDFDSAGVPARALAGNQAAVRGMAADFFPDPDRPIRCVLFESRRLDCYGLFDPRYLDVLDRIDVLDARRLDRAEFSNVYATGGGAAVFFPPDIPWQLLVARGAVNNRMLLINADAAHPSGVGFDTTDLAAIGPLPWRNVLDLEALNGQRQRDLQRFGISSQLINDLHDAAVAQIQAARSAEQSRDYPAFFAATNAAWSLESQVYQNLIDTSNGIIKGVIFLLLGIIPFSYFLERLLIGATTIYRQITGFFVIFAAMTGALWFHPAFRISSAPLMILLAFLILILSAAVVYILWGKFEEEIARLRGVAGTAAHSTSLRRGAVLGAAVRLGLSNMRRRGLRTALTLLTLILLTFTLLCFTSVTEAVEITPRPILFAAARLPPPGILLRQRGWSPLPPQAMSYARELAWPESEATHGSGLVAARWWYASQIPEEPWLIPVRLSRSSDTSDNRGKGEAAGRLPATTATTDITVTTANNPFPATALLGLDASEAAFQSVAIDSVLPGFSRLADSPGLCWLPQEATQSAPFAVGDTVEILGHHLTVAGFFNDASFGKLRELTGDPLSPVDLSGLGNQPSVTLGGGAARRGALFEPPSRFLGASSIAIVPASLVEKIGGQLTSIMIRPAGAAPESFLPRAESLARRSAFTVYVSDGARVRAINAAQSSEPRDFSTVLVPMLIAAVIILNAMLGAVAERTNEIHVYTSIGLAPAHVGMLFLAEAAALGTIGVVSGYIFGQGLATLLSWTHLLPGMDLNYSSLSAIVTMGLVLGLVMLSALWPARAASRVAAPSLERRWKLPKPIGDVLYVELPFTVNETAAKGVIAFIDEFLVTTTQTGGHFTADFIKPLFDRSSTSAHPIRGLTARIWLAPYDLGVIQQIRLAIHSTPEHNIFDVHLELTREAGNPATWRRLNRRFLVDIRKQFLLWRTLAPAQVQNYLDKSAALFASAAPAASPTPAAPPPE